MESVRRKLLPNPREKANTISILLFWWTIQMFRKGYRKVLDITDIYQPLTVDRSENLGNRLEKHWLNQLKKNGRRSLVLAIASTFWREYLLLGTYCVINDVFIRLTQPYLLGQLLNYFRKDSTMTKYDALHYAAGIVTLNAFSTLVLNQYFIGAFHYGMKVRVAVCSIIYRKSLRLSQTALGETAVGKIVNLLSNDVNRFDIISILIHSMWTGPLLALIIGYLLFIEVGWAGMIGIAIVFIVVPIQSYTGKLSSKFRLQTALRTDERVRFMDEIISGVQVIKMYAWEIPFTKMITYARKMELNIVRKSSYVRGLYMTFTLFTTRMALFCTMLSLVLLYGSDQLTAAKVFTISAYFNIVAHTMSQLFVRGVAEIAEAMVAFRRLQNFLEYEEKDDFDLAKKVIDLSSPPTKTATPTKNGDLFVEEKQNLINSQVKMLPNQAIVIKNLRARWIPLSKLEQQVNHYEEMVKKLNNDEAAVATIKPITPTSNNSTSPFNGSFSPNDSGVCGQIDCQNDETLCCDDENNKNNDQIINNNLWWKRPTLQNLNLTVKKGSLIGVVGHVGSGKTSLLQAILRELSLECGTISICGSVSYAAQESWVFAGSIRQNILFGQDMDRNRYDSVVKSCALIKDFEQFEFNDKTIIGERGTSLSGGQKARVNLARAVYREADIYLLDDPLSAVDAHVGKHLFDECIGPNGRLAKRHATRILATHQVHFLKDADWVIVLSDGEIKLQGSAADLSHSGIDVATLLQADDPINNDETSCSNIMARRRSRTHSGTSTRSYKSSTITEPDLDNINRNDDREKSQSVELLQQLEQTSKGQVRGSVAGAYLKSGTNICVLLIIFGLFALTQIFASGADYWVSYWTGQEELRHYYENENINYLANNNSSSNITKSDGQEQQNMSNHTENVVKSKLWGIFNGGLYGLMTTEICMYIHGGLMASLFIAAIVRSLSFYTVCVRASQKLHDCMFKGIISTTMRFFDTNPSGRILNRFSKDMGATDEFLPKAILDAGQIILNMAGAITVTSIVKPIFLIPVAFIGIIFLFVRKVYVKTSKNIKRLEGTTRSPVFTHLSATLNGLSTIRAFGAEAVLIDEFDNHQDLHTACWYMFISTSSAFGLVLDIMCFVFITVITFTFVLVEQEIMGDQVGLAITQAMSLTGMLQWGIRQSAEVTNQLMSVERILEYRDLEPELNPSSDSAKVIPIDWPDNGQIEFCNVVYKYFVGADPVLKGLSFIVKPREKVGIVGRTGAGKSSLISAIFRLAIVEGIIRIDDIDTSTINLADLRSKVSIIPQDPILFSGTIRRNLDPFEEYQDMNIWKALEEVELKEIVSGPMGLQSLVMAGGSNFSVGQRQLICLARAILRNNRILVLDEATANVDPHTDSLIQQTIRIKFSECTVLTVAHRLHTIIDSDRVLVMDSGQAAEFASPHELLETPTSILYEMVHTLGPKEMERLTKMAKDKYESNKKMTTTK